MNTYGQTPNNQLTTSSFLFVIFVNKPKSTDSESVNFELLHRL